MKSTCELRGDARKDVRARIRRAGDGEIFGSGDYAMRVWLNPTKSRSKIYGSDVVNAIREQNVQGTPEPIGSAAGPRTQ